jgi:hypothetical protein
LKIYVVCHGAPSCKSEDECLREAGLSVGGTAATEYESACKAKRTACPNSLDNDVCTAAAFAYTGLGSKAAACLTKSCAELPACFQAAVKPITDCKN